MDGVIIFFGTARPADVESALDPWGYVDGVVRSGETVFYLRPYSQLHQDAELDDEESARLRALLEGTPRSAFAIDVRHGDDARFALKVVADLMSRFEDSALDDDFGHLWSKDEVVLCARADPAAGIYALRDPAARRARSAQHR